MSRQFLGMRLGAWPLRCRCSTQNALPSLLCLRGSVGNAAARVALPGSLGNTMVSVAFIGEQAEMLRV